MAERAELPQDRWGWPSWRLVLWIVALASIFLVPYAQLEWWGFAHTTIALLVLMGWRHGRRALGGAGFPLRMRARVASLLLMAALWAVFRYVLVEQVATQQGLSLEPWPVKRVARFGFQALNEEIVLGALPLFALVRRWPHPRVVAIGLALVFAALHAALYRYGALQCPLETRTLVALAAVGIVRNAAILIAGHIGFAWALHAAWNFVMFSGTWRTESTGTPLLEPEVLDALVGTPVVLVAAVAAAVVLLLLPVWRDRPRRSGT